MTLMFISEALCELVEVWSFGVGGLIAASTVLVLILLFLYGTNYFDNVSSSPVWWLRYFQIFMARMVLDVWGGAGAIWGFSEVLTLRNPENLWFWRPVSLLVGTVFFYRWLLQLVDYSLEEIKGTDIQQNTNQTLRMYQIFSAKLVLEVFGGAGAVWGFSEALTLRNFDTLWFWRPTALVFGLIFFVRWIMQIVDFCSMGNKHLNTTNNNNSSNWTRLFLVFSSPMVLEVWGASGAIWGLSEILTFRIPNTLWFWRTAALTIGAIFFFRWLFQIHEYILTMDDVNHFQHLDKQDQTSKHDKSFESLESFHTVETVICDDFTEAEDSDNSDDLTETENNEHDVLLHVVVQYGTNFE